MNIRQKIEDALKAKDVSYAHVLLHSLAHVYNHTPYPVRKERLMPFAEEFATLCTCCLKGCSQVGKTRLPNTPGAPRTI